jgi:hypothetical protein
LHSLPAKKANARRFSAIQRAFLALSTKQTKKEKVSHPFFPAYAPKIIHDANGKSLVCVYESDAPPLSDFHQKLISLFIRPLYQLGTFFERQRMTRFEKAVFKLVYHLRSFVWRLHDRRIQNTKSNL